MLDFGSVPLVEVIWRNRLLRLHRFSRGSFTHEMPVAELYESVLFSSGFAPFFLLYFFHVRSKWFWPVFGGSGPVHYHELILQMSYSLILYQFDKTRKAKDVGFALLLLLGFLCM